MHRRTRGGGGAIGVWPTTRGGGRGEIEESYRLSRFLSLSHSLSLGRRLRR